MVVDCEVDKFFVSGAADQMRDELACEVTVALSSWHVRGTVLRQSDLPYQESA
jgi:hypothetical protein